MIKSWNEGRIKIEGEPAVVLADYIFITSCLTKMGHFDREDMVVAFCAGLFHDEIEASGKSREECWDLLGEYAKKLFGKEVDDAHR